MRPRPLIAIAPVAATIAALALQGAGGGVVGEAGPNAPAVGPSQSPPAERSRDPWAGPRAGPLATLQRTVAAGPRVARRATVRIGRSVEGRSIRAVATNGRGTGPLVVVFGCIHGDECAGIRVARRIYTGAPPSGTGIVVVPDLDPDGLALGTRLNTRGVDLNRNFAAGWRPIGVPGDLEHSGERPFSEPETRVARRLIRSLRPDVTIWFHQQAEPLVRAWRASVSAARRYARLAGTRFVRLPWLDGTAPNWQNHRFGGTSSFVVELASGGTTPDTVRAHAAAAGQLAGVLDGGGR